MKTIVPDYYAAFACKAGACRHTCCAGWEIDVDEDTLALYQQLPGAFGDQLRASLQEDESGTVSFRLTADERCPMLRADGLCELICRHGEGALCQICNDHPRFRSFFTDRTEMGLGLCCEAAAELILSREQPVRLVELENDGGTERLTPAEQRLLAFRLHLMLIAQDRALPMSERLYLMCEAVDAPMPVMPAKKVLAFLSGLEQLDPAWGERLQCLTQKASITPANVDRFTLPAEQLAVYLLLRHLPGAMEDERFRARTLMVVWAVLLLCTLSTDDADMMDAARQFSAEIEYSDENIEAVLDWLGEECNGADGLL